MVNNNQNAELKPSRIVFYYLSLWEVFCLSVVLFTLFLGVLLFVYDKSSARHIGFTKEFVTTRTTHDYKNFQLQLKEPLVNKLTTSKVDTCNRLSEKNEIKSWTTSTKPTTDYGFKIIATVTSKTINNYFSSGGA